MDTRYATPAEAQAELETNWDGDRCPHGKPVGMMVGYDNPCGPCEHEAQQGEAERLFYAELDATGRYPFPIGPDRADRKRRDSLVRMGIIDRPEPITTDVPF